MDARPSGQTLYTQRRARAVAMARDEVHAFLQSERVVRVGSVNANGRPHVVPLWFVWDGGALWLNSLVNSRRWRDLERNPWVSAVVDAGVAYDELRGVVINGGVEVASEVPRGDASLPAVEEIERTYARKYRDTDVFVPDGRHAWLRIVPEQIVSWDFSKIAHATPAT